ncbi:tetratricopeptide repeat protein [Neisseria chenwenguii]|uniref:tetratricopeptide repeat protein n=1 Tax=Neisseria chenwenguii TaxID=1853278 RepID=UPI000F509DED|nr:tetratricopeptide repeat protein [Neisseria chenwenguii]ROV57334.1 hypothetical protein EGS38_01250 [Neisseria chenwenguii]
MNIIKQTAILLSIIALSACANLPPPAPDSAEAVPDKHEDYRRPGKQSELNRLNMQLAGMEYEIERLKTRVQQLERSGKIPSEKRPPADYRINDAKLKNQYLKSSAAGVGADDTVAARETRLYAHASKLYKSGNYAAAAALKGADGGNGSDAARRNMFLLVQSQQKLGNCETAIETAGRLANRFRGTSEAPEALFVIGQCQYRMQQKDIARNTWRKLIQTYPDSPAAKRAAVSIKQR